MFTENKLYTGALKSRQSLHMTANLDPANVKEHIKQHELKELDSLGADQGSPVDTIKGDAHIERTYGNRYQWREGADFNYGLNATYNFGQQYVENHADEELDAKATFDIPGLDSNESSAAGNVDDALQTGLADERKAGLVQKNFGNQYIYDEGITRTWAAGPGSCREHVTLNFGGRYIENQLKNDSGDPDTSGINGLVSDSTLAIKTVGDEARYNEGVIDVHHKGEMKHVQTGNHTSEITGDVTETITGNVTKEITGDITKNITGTADAVTLSLSGNQDYTATIGGNVTETSTISGNYTVTLTAGSIAKTVTGSLDWIKSAESQLVLGAHTDNFAGFKSGNSLAGVQETYLGVKITTNHGAFFENKKTELGKKEVTLTDVKSVINKAKMKISQAKMTILN